MKPVDTIKLFVLGGVVILMTAWPTPMFAGPARITVPRAAHGALTKAQGLMEKEDYASAVTVLKSFQDRKPQWLERGQRDPDGYLHYLVDFNLGNCYLALNLPIQAISHYELVLAVQPEFSAAWMNLAKACYDTGKYRQAAESFLRGYDTSDEKQPDSLYYAAVSHIADDDHDNALKVLLRLFAEYPDDTKTAWREQLVQVYMTRETPRKALPHIEILAQTTEGKRQRQWQEMLFYQYRALKMKKKALTYARRMVRSYPTQPKWWKAMASLHLDEGRHRQALTALMACSYLNPANDKAAIPVSDYRLLGDLSINQGIPVQASRYYAKVLEKRKDPGDYKRWILSYVRQHRPALALAAANEALKHRDDPDIKMLKGEVLYDSGRYDEVVATLSEVVEKKPDAGRAWLMMGYVAWQTKEYALAKIALARAIEFPFQRDTAERLLTQLDQLINRN